MEVASIGETVAMRDAKRADSPVLMFTAGSWRDFLAGIRDGQFDTASPEGDG